MDDHCGFGSLLSLKLFHIGLSGFAFTGWIAGLFGQHAGWYLLLPVGCLLSTAGSLIIEYRQGTMFASTRYGRIDWETMPLFLTPCLLTLLVPHAPRTVFWTVWMLGVLAWQAYSVVKNLS